MVFHWPQIVYIVLIAMGLGLALSLDGKPRTGKYSFLWSLFAAGSGAAILYYGGFFTGGQ